MGGGGGGGGGEVSTRSEGPPSVCKERERDAQNGKETPG